jgi:hypothetical protein
MTDDRFPHCHVCNSEFFPFCRTEAEAGEKCRCAGDKDDCHGCRLWPDDDAPQAPAAGAEVAPSEQQRAALEAIGTLRKHYGTSPICCGNMVPGHPGDGWMQPPDGPECCQCHDRDVNTLCDVIANVLRAPACNGVSAEPPKGWKLVPVEPTEEMLAAAHEGDRAYTLRTFGDVMTIQQGPHDHWVAMIAAVPPAPPVGGSHG